MSYFNSHGLGRRRAAICWQDYQEEGVGEGAANDPDVRHATPLYLQTLLN